MKAKIPYLHMWSDWSTQEVKEIETDDYAYFRIESRGSSWYISGYNKKYNLEENLSGAGCYLPNVVEFFHNNKEKIKQINVLHFNKTNDAFHVFFKTYEKFLKKIEGNTV